MARQVPRIDSSWNKYSPDVAAKPVDTYVTPERVPQESGYERLASALAGIHKPLNRFAKDRFDEQQETEEAEGKKLYTEKGMGLSWEDFTDTYKEIGQTEAKKRGYLAMRMSNEAALLKQSLEEAYEKGEASVKLPNGEVINVALSDDPAAFDTWMRRSISNYIQKNLGDDIPSEIFSSVFIPQMNEYTKTLTGKHIENRGRIIQTRLESEFGGMIFNTVTQYVKDGKLVLDDEESMQEAANQLSAQARAAMAHGLSLDRTLNNITQVLTGIVADENFKDFESLLTLAKRVEIAPGIVVGNLGNEYLALNKAGHTARIQRGQREEKEKKDKEEAERKARDEFWRGVAERAARGERISREELAEAIKKLPGITMEESAAMVARGNILLDYDKPPVDNYGRDLARQEREALNLFEFLRKSDGYYTVDSLFDAGAAGKLTGRQMVQLFPGVIDANGPLGVIKMRTANLVKGAIQSVALDNLKFDTNYGTMGKTTFIQNAVYKQFEEEAGKNPMLKSDYGLAEKRIAEIALDLSRKFKDVRLNVFEGVVPGTEKGDKQIQAGIKKQRSFVQPGAPEILQNWKTLGADYIKAVRAGTKPEDTHLIKVLAKMGYTPQDFEQMVGMKLDNYTHDTKSVKGKAGAGLQKIDKTR